MKKVFSLVALTVCLCFIPLFLGCSGLTALVSNFGFSNPGFLGILALGSCLTLGFTFYTKSSSSQGVEKEKTALLKPLNSKAFSFLSKAGDSKVQTLIPEFIDIKENTITGAIPFSNVFVQGRSVHIGSLKVCSHQVTRAEFETFCKSSSKRIGLKSRDIPLASNTNWYDAIVYCNLRSMAEGFTPVYTISGETSPMYWKDICKENTGSSVKYSGPSVPNVEWDEVKMDIAANGYRLPTEAEWEYITQGVNKDNYTYSENTWEWCFDWYGHICEKTGSEGVDFGYDRVLRCASLDNKLTYKNKNYPDCRQEDFTFRVVRSVS